MRIKTLIALLLSLLVFTSLASAQEATVEAPDAQATVEVELIPPVEVELAVTEEATAAESESAAGDAEAVAEEAAVENETSAGAALLMLLLGIGVVILVGSLTVLRSNTKPPQA